jgi:hypothetical protein
MMVHVDEDRARLGLCRFELLPNFAGEVMHRPSAKIKGANPAAQKK